MTASFQGAYTALVTPFRNDGSLDEDALKRLVDFQISGNIDGLALCGTTGEESTLTLDERSEIVRICRNHSGPDFTLIGGASANATSVAVEFATALEDAGADAILSVVPFYNKPTQEGILEHLSRVADAVRVPVILSNVPSRTGCKLEPETALRLAVHNNIAAIDEGSGDLEFVMTVLAEAPDGFSVLSGDDDLTFPMIVLGAHGALSLISNELPAQVKQMVDHARSGNIDAAKTIHYEMLALANINYIETNPIPVKAALHMMGLIENSLRLPLLPLTEANRTTLHDALSELKLAPLEDLR